MTAEARYVMQMAVCCTPLLLAAILSLPMARIGGSYHRVLSIQLLLAVLVEMTGTAMASFYRNTAWLYNAYTTLEFLLLLFILFKIRPQWKLVWVMTACLGTAGMVLSAMYTDPVHDPLTEGFVLAALLLSMGHLAVLWDLANKSIVPMTRLPEFWLLLGGLLYFAGMFPVIGTLKYVTRSYPDLARSLYAIMLVLMMIRYLLTGLSCSLSKRTLDRAQQHIE